MDHSQVFSDAKLKNEFLDRFPELAASAPKRGLEGLEDIPSVDDAATAVKSMREGTWKTAGGGDLEAIIERFTRPVLLVQNDTYVAPADAFPNSVEIGRTVDAAKAVLNAAIPRVGRIDLRNHRASWVGTAWMVAKNIVATNRHVAEEFAKADGNGFAFRSAFDGRRVSPSIDWKHEHRQPTESVFRVRKVLWIEPDPSFDVALLEISAEGDDAQAQPTTFDLMTEADLAASGVGSWVAVIGYPAQDSRNSAADQQRIFDGIYNVKRLAPGKITAIRPDGIATHDATTLGGNSGSAVVDLATGKVIALHFGGLEGEANYAVQAPKIATILRAHAL